MATIEIERWGRDHWTTLLYVETRMVDHHGTIAGQYMRTHVRRHPRLYGWLSADGRTMQNHPHLPPDAQGHPTRLRGGETAEHHDDWDCLRDMREAGLIEIINPRARIYWEVEPGRRGPLRGPGGGIGGTPLLVRVRLTDRGWAMVAALREHRGRTGGVGTFDPAVLA